MNYYEVLVATKNKTNQLLTYVSENELEPRSIVRVPLRRQIRPGLVWNKVSAHAIPEKLKNKCRAVDSASPYCLPETLVQAVWKLGENSSLSLSALAQLLLSNAPPSKPRKPAKTAEVTTAKKSALTDAQTVIYQAITNAGPGRPQLLLGVNGSGKTRLYAELIADQLKAGRSSLVLVPEIGLSQQVLAILREYLGTSVEIFHSQLTPSARKAVWVKCLEHQQPLVVVGARSAEFLPFKELGLIILDEFHDDSFKQEAWPSYHSLPMASCLAKIHKAQLVCGSATPRVEDYYHFLRARYPVHHLQERALAAARKPRILIIDKRGQKNIFAAETLAAVAATLKRGCQLLIFYNRRGDWRLAECGQCFWQAECPACDRHLVFHRDKFKLICHVCGKSQKPVSVCPECHQAVHYGGIGLKAVEAELAKHLTEMNLQFPIWRFDGDNPKEETLSARLQTIKDQPLALIGTQIIAQGLDLPHLQTVIILDAEQSLLTPDYRSQEKYYRQIHQLSGRVGRGHLDDTQVIIQSWQPDSPVLHCAVQQDWQGFYRQEISQRREHHLPPFVHLANISIRRSTEAGARKTAQLLHRQLNRRFAKVKFYPPAPALRTKRSGLWEWLIHACTPNRKNLIEVAAYFKDQEYFFNLDPTELFATGP